MNFKVLFVNIKNVYMLFKHSFLNFFLKKKITADPDLNLKFLKQIKKKGFYEFIIEEKNLDNFKEIVKQEIKKYYPKSEGDTRLYGIENASSIINDFFSKIIEKEIKLLDSSKTINKDLYVHAIMGGCLENKNLTSSGGGWHRDHYFEQYKVMIYLTDVKTENGPFSYLIKSHYKFYQGLSLLLFKLFSKNHTRFTDFSIKILKLLLFEQRIFVGKKGTCIVFNATGLHRGLPITEGERVSLTAYIFEKSNNKELYDARSDHMNIPIELRD